MEAMWRCCWHFSSANRTAFIMNRLHRVRHYRRNTCVTCRGVCGVMFVWKVQNYMRPVFDSSTMATRLRIQLSLYSGLWRSPTFSSPTVTIFSRSHSLRPFPPSRNQIERKLKRQEAADRSPQIWVSAMLQSVETTMVNACNFRMRLLRRQLNAEFICVLVLYLLYRYILIKHRIW